MYFKRNSKIDKLNLFFLNGVSIIFKTLSLIYLKLKSLRQKRFPDTLVISIDNLSFGGTGKTSLVMEIGKNFEKKGQHDKAGHDANQSHGDSGFRG